MNSDHCRGFSERRRWGVVELASRRHVPTGGASIAPLPQPYKGGRHDSANYHRTPQPTSPMSSLASVSASAPDLVPHRLVELLVRQVPALGAGYVAVNGHDAVGRGHGRNRSWLSPGPDAAPRRCPPGVAPWRDRRPRPAPGQPRLPASLNPRDRGIEECRRHPASACPVRADE